MGAQTEPTPIILQTEPTPIILAPELIGLRVVRTGPVVDNGEKARAVLYGGIESMWPMTTFPVASIRHLPRALLIALLAPGGTAEEPPPIRFLMEWGTKGTGPGQFHFPIGIALDPAGEVLVTDFSNDRLQTNHRIQKFATR